MDNSFSEKAYKLEGLTILSPNGAMIDVGPQMLQISIFEDIYNSTVSGMVVLKDGNDFFAKIPLSGFEFISVSFSKPNGAEKTSFAKIFRIYKMTGPVVKPSNAAVQSYIIHFCSEENIVSLSRRISKSYSGKIISDIILDILQNQLLVVPGKILPQNIEATKGRHNIIIPNMNPLTAVTWLTSRATKVSESGVSACYMFYENSEGYNLKSLETLFEKSAKRQYVFGSKNVETGDPKSTVQTQIQTVIEYEFVSNFDMISAITSGMYSSVLKGVDLTRNRVDDSILNYIDFFNKTKHIENDTNNNSSSRGRAYPFHVDYQDRLKNPVEKNYFSSLKMYPTNKNHNTYSQISSKQPGITPNLVEAWMLQRTSQVNQLNHLKLKLLVPGDTAVTVGDVIEFMVPLSQTHSAQAKNENPYHSGRYLVTAIRHVISNESYEMIIEATRDCISINYPPVNLNSPVMTSIRKL